MKLVIIIVVATMAITGGLIFGMPYLQGTASTGGVVEVNPKEYDAGDVSMAAGLVKKDYEIKNIGSGPLKISSIATSCDCTKAIFKIGDKISPEFSMPGMGQNPVFWSESLAPGETGILEMIFDPNFHGASGIGPIIRAAYISTNDPQNKIAEVRLSANVIH